MQFAQRTLLLTALFLASASWFQAQSPADAGIEVPEKNASIGRELEGTWVGTLVVNGTRLRFVLAMRTQSGSTKLLPGSDVN